MQRFSTDADRHESAYQTDPYVQDSRPALLFALSDTIEVTKGREMADLVLL
jgi:hypothetical protein